MVKLKIKFFNNTRKPKGFLGDLMITRMNKHHSSLSNWALNNFPQISPLRIIEIGCGGGKNAYDILSKYEDAYLLAIDYSTRSVRRATRLNHKYIKNKRCDVQSGDVTELNIQNTFDLATAFETVYFWQDIEKSFVNVRNSLKDGGLFIIVNESDGTNEQSTRWNGVIEGLTIYTPDELKMHLENAHFSKIEILHHIDKPWIMAFAYK